MWRKNSPQKYGRLPVGVPPSNPPRRRLAVLGRLGAAAMLLRDGAVGQRVDASLARLCVNADGLGPLPCFFFQYNLQI